MLGLKSEVMVPLSPNQESGGGVMGLESVENTKRECVVKLVCFCFVIR